MTASTRPIPASRKTPLWAVLTLTFLCSIGSGVVYGGVFFLAKSQYGFSDQDNYLLALLFGVMYVPGAYLAGPILRRLRAGGITPRTALVALMLVLGCLCFVPLAADRLGAASASWPLWLVILIYSPLSGGMWPIVESFLAGGRTEHELRAATGRFNITWSGAIVVTMLAIAPHIEHRALLIIAALGLVHLACLAVVARFTPVPGAHEHHDHHRPVVYRQLLTFLRMFLPVSFMFNSALSPYMPAALKALGVAVIWQTPVTAVWCTTRVLTFLAMERWHGWHGRWTTPIVGALLLLASFAWVVLVPMFAPASLGLTLFIIGLCGFGVGVGIIYAAALYYAMEVGASGVDAGGTHETLIGIGYTAGPLCLLAGVGAAGANWVPEESATLLTLGLVAVAAIAVGCWAIGKAVRVSRAAA